MIVDNHELVRRGLAALVNAEEDMVACAEVACTPEVVDTVIQCRPDVVIIDVSPSRGAGLEVIQRIRKRHTNIRIVAVAMSDKPELVERSLNEGATAFVVKTELATRLLDAIRRNQPERIASADAKAERPSNARSERCLDVVEREIVELIGRGVPTRAIAVRLGMSVAMVENHRRRIRKKLNFPTATQLVQFCVRWAERNSKTPVSEI